MSYGRLFNRNSKRLSCFDFVIYFYDFLKCLLFILYFQDRVLNLIVGSFTALVVAVSTLYYIKFPQKKSMPELFEVPYRINSDYSAKLPSDRHLLTDNKAISLNFQLPSCVITLPLPRDLGP